MKTIVFDLDGTLLDSRPRHKIVLKKTIESMFGNYMKINLDDYILYKTTGKNTADYLMEQHHFSFENAMRVSKKWQAVIEMPEYLQYDILYTDSIPILETLSERYSLVLLTARQNEGVMFDEIKSLKISGYFSTIKCVNPYNALIEKTSFLQKLQFVILSIGDTEVDYKAALSNDVVFYALNRGFRNEYYWNALQVKSFSNFSDIEIVLHK